MSPKRNISWLKLIRALFSLSVILLSYLAITSSAHTYRQRPISGMEVVITNPWLGFVQPQTLKAMLVDHRGLQLDSLSLDEVDIHQMERMLLSNPWIQTAKVYVDRSHKIQVEVCQRTPLIRVWDEEGNNLYLDSAGELMPISAQYVHYGLVVTYSGDIETLDSSDRSQILTLARFIRADSFWNAQTAQLIYQKNKEFELVPMLGSQRILIGRAKQLEEKFGNLLLFYDQALSEIGWDQYEVLDLRFQGQVVASPKLNLKNLKQRIEAKVPLQAMGSPSLDAVNPAIEASSIDIDQNEPRWNADQGEGVRMDDGRNPIVEVPPAKPPDRVPIEETEDPQPKYIYSPEQ